MKQAIVVIHGIGEQRPMATIRKFVDAIIPERSDPTYPKFHNKPDPMNESFELRLLRSLASRRKRRPTTDFYEFYWAHHMRDSKIVYVYSWIARLLFRFPWNTPVGLRTVYYSLWIGFLLILLFLAWGVLDVENTNDIFERLKGTYKQKQTYFALLLGIGQMIFSWFLLRYVADAARYLTPAPDNIKERNKIRAEGIALLRKVHESKKYSRIVIVGHSLGSVIAYDLIRFLWNDLRDPHELGKPKQAELTSFDAECKNIFGNKETSDGQKIEEFQQKQHRLWRELRGQDYKSSWLITDFITLGSPMAHGMILMADDKDVFARQKKEFEYPTCPPTSSPDGLYYEKEFTQKLGNQSQTVNIKVPHHGAPFCCTRWTNIFIPYRCLFFGDLIAGPIRQVFGLGIKDIPVKLQLDNNVTSSFTNKILYVFSNTLMSHVCYWDSFSKNSLSTFMDNFFCGKIKKYSLRALKSALRLNSLHSKDPWPEP